MSQTVREVCPISRFFDHLARGPVNLRHKCPLLRGSLPRKLGTVNDIINFPDLLVNAPHEHGTAHIGIHAMNLAAIIQDHMILLLDDALIAAVMGKTGIRAGGHQSTSPFSAEFLHLLRQVIPDLSFADAWTDEIAGLFKCPIRNARSDAQIFHFFRRLADPHFLQKTLAAAEGYLHLVFDIKKLKRLHGLVHQNPAA